MELGRHHRRVGANNTSRVGSRVCWLILFWFLFSLIHSFPRSANYVNVCIVCNQVVAEESSSHSTPSQRLTGLMIYVDCMGDCGVEICQGHCYLCGLFVYSAKNKICDGIMVKITSISMGQLLHFSIPTHSSV